MDVKVVLACGLLLCQNVVEALLLHLSRAPGREPYVMAGAVLMMQLVKIKLSFVILFCQGYTWPGIVAYFRGLSFYEGYVQYSIPSILYTIQNNLRFLSLSHLSPSAYQMLVQLKILSTAVFSIVFLNRKIHRLQWVALMLLLCGLSIAELQQMRGESDHPPTASGAGEAEKTAEAAASALSHTIGVIAVLLVAFCSGLAGAWTEKVTKRRMDVSIAFVNIQLATFSIIESTLYILASKGPRFLLSPSSFFKGYDFLTWAAIYLGATGGTLVGLVVRYTSSIAKTYLVSTAIFANAGLDYLIFPASKAKINAEFLISAAVVFCSIILFNDPLLGSPVGHHGGGAHNKLATPSHAGKEMVVVDGENSEEDKTHLLQDDDDDKHNHDETTHSRRGSRGNNNTTNTNNLHSSTSVSVSVMLSNPTKKMDLP